MSDDKIEKIRITLALNAKQIAERMLSGEVTSDSDFVSQEDHQHVARRLLDLLAASHREIAKLRAEIERLRAALKQFRCSCDPGECVEYGERWASVCEKGEARAALEAKP